MMAEPMSDEELYQLTGSWEAAAAMRDEQARGATQNNTRTATANVAAPSKNITLEELKKMYAEKGATTQRITQSGDAGDVIDYLTNDLGQGFTAREDQPIIGYEGQGMDATPIYGDKVLSGFTQAKDGRDYFYDPEGVFQGSQKSQKADTFWDTFGPLIMGAVTMGGGGAFLGNSLFGLTGTAAAGAGGALAGGVNAALTDQNILTGALKGGVGGAGAMELGNTGFTLGDATKAINFAQNPSLTGAVNLASPYLDTNFNIGDTGFTTNDVLKGLNTVQALGSGNDKKVFDAITGLAKTYGGPTSGGTGSNAVSTITDLTEEDIAELNPGELQAYRDKGVQGISDFRKDMKLLGSLSNSGYAGDDLGGNVTENLTNTTAKTGATLNTAQDILDYIDSLGTDTIKDSGLSNQDILNMIGLGADDAVTVTGDRPTGLGDFIIPTSNIGDQGEIVITGNKNGTSLDDFLSLNTPVGNITNNYTDDLNELVITGNKNGTSLNDFITLNDIVGNTDTTGTTKDDGVEELVVTGKTDKDVVVDDDDDDDDTKCGPGFHDDGTGFCVPDDDVKEDGCPEGYVLDLATNQCVKVGDTKVTVPPKAVTKKKTEDMMADLGLRREAPSQDPYANIKSMEDLFSGDIAYKLRALGMNPSQKTASADMDELVRLLRG